MQEAESLRMGTIREREDSMAGNTSQPSIKRVWGIAKSPELKLTDEELHLLVQAHTGKDSIKALNKRELQTVIRVLGNMKDSAKKSERGRNRYSGSEVTENQRKKIYKLTQELGWDKPASQSAESKDWYFEEATVNAAIELTKYLMQKYGVPASNVIRHHDVTGKICPNPYVYNSTKHTWDVIFWKGVSSTLLHPEVTTLP